MINPENALAIGAGLGALLGGYGVAKKGAHKGASEGAAALNGAAKRLERLETSVDHLGGKMDRYALATERRLTRLETIHEVEAS